jgi:hypothetical protein
MSYLGVHKSDLERVALVLGVVIFAKAVEKIGVSRYSFITSRKVKSVH